jgi:hypothetical protein
MIADIKGKLSRTGHNLNDMLEDNLTGNFFGALRYIPFDLALRNIFSRCVQQVGDLIGKISADFGAINKFWPHDEEGNRCYRISMILLSVSAKYASGLSSEDGIDNSALIDTQTIEEPSKNQLSKESRTFQEKAR